MAAPPPASRGRAWAGLALRAGPALALLAVSIHLALPRDAGGRLDASALVAALDAPLPVALGWTLVGFALFGATLATAALRFHVLMRAARVPTRFASALRLFLVATAFNTVLPGGVLGDAWRVWEGHDRLRRGPTVLGVVALERLLGLQALGAVALCGAPWAPRGALPDAAFAGLVGVAATCTLLPFVLLLPTTARLGRALGARLPPRLGRLRRIAQESAAGLVAVRTDPRRTALAIVLSLVCQAIPVVAVAALARPLAGSVALPWLVVVVPFVTLASMLPISIGGTGVRELLFVTLLGRLGMPPAAALALALATGLVNLAWAGVGLGLFAFGARDAGDAGEAS